MLQLEGILTPTPSPDDDIFEFDNVSDEKSSDFPMESFRHRLTRPAKARPRGARPAPPRRPCGISFAASRPPSTRQGQDADSQEERTEAMKEVTALPGRRSGQLIELEKVWLAGACPDPGTMRTRRNGAAPASSKPTAS